MSSNERSHTEKSSGSGLLKVIGTVLNAYTEDYGPYAPKQHKDTNTKSRRTHSHECNDRTHENRRHKQERKQRYQQESDFDREYRQEKESRREPWSHREAPHDLVRSSRYYEEQARSGSLTHRREEDERYENRDYHGQDQKDRNKGRRELEDGPKLLMLTEGPKQRLCAFDMLRGSKTKERYV